MSILSEEVDAKAKAALDEAKIEWSQKDIDEFIQKIEPNVNLIFQIKKAKIEDYDIVVTHDKNSKQKVPVLISFVRKSKALVK